MGKKKKNRGPMAFQNNPFKNLKGLSGFREGKQPPAVKPPPPLKPPSEPETDEEAFAREMDLLGVDRVNGEEGAREEGPSQGKKPLAAEVERGRPKSDEELFLESLGRMDTTFQDEFPEPEETTHASPRRMKQVKQGKLLPEAELDLHGLTREEAREKVGHFLEDSCYGGMESVLVVTGRGNHSERGPVLRDEVERFLAGEGRTWVLEWSRAPRRYGGEGALVVFLRRGKKS